MLLEIQSTSIILEHQMPKKKKRTQIVIKPEASPRIGFEIMGIEIRMIWEQGKEAIGAQLPRFLLGRIELSANREKKQKQWLDEVAKNAKLVLEWRKREYGVLENGLRVVFCRSEVGFLRRFALLLRLGWGIDVGFHCCYLCSFHLLSSSRSSVH